MAAGAPTILLADDEPILLRLVSRVLSSAGYRVRSTASAEEARRALGAADPPDAVVLDATLARRLGDDLLAQLWSSSDRPAVVLMSGAELESPTAQLLARARGRFLAKPFEPSQLLLEVREALASREGA